jgi:hypothetical protein
VVLEPFLGSGTTGIVEMNNQRNYVGYDIEEKYVKLAQKRIKEQRGELGSLRFFLGIINSDFHWKKKVCMEKIESSIHNDRQIN